MASKATRKSNDITKTPPRASASARGNGVTPGTQTGARAQGKPKRTKSKKEKEESQSKRFLDWLGTKTISPMAKNKEEGAVGNEGGGKVASEPTAGTTNKEGNVDAATTPKAAGGFNPSKEDFEVDMTTAGAKIKPKGTRKAEKAKKAADRKAVAEAANKAAKVQEQTLFTKQRKSKTIAFDGDLAKDNYTHNITMEGSVKLKGPLKDEAVLKTFQRKLGDTIADARKVTHWDFGILPLDTSEKNARAVINAKGLTKFEMAYSMKKNYLHISNTRAFTNIDEGKQRTVRFFFVMGYNQNPDDKQTFLELLSEIGPDLWNAKGVGMGPKANQELDTSSNLAFLGAPSRTDISIVTKIVNKVLQETEEKMVEENSEEYPKDVHGTGTQISYALTKGAPYGLPWEPPKKDNAPREDNGRRAFVFQVKRDEEERLEAVLAVAKANEAWLPYFGKAAYTVRMISTWEQGPDVSERRQQYINNVISHGSAELSRGYLAINGLHNVDATWTLRRVDSDGNELPPIKRTVIDLIKYIKVENIKVFMTVLPSESGVYYATYSSVFDPHKLYAKDFASGPAAFLYWWCLHHGINIDDLQLMLKGTFSLSEQQKVSRSRYSKSQRKAVIPAKLARDLTSYAENSVLVDTSLGLNDREKRERAQERAGDFIHYGEALPGSLEAYNKFSSGNSVNTNTPGKKRDTSNLSVGGETFAKTVCSLDQDTTVAGEKADDDVDVSSTNSFDTLRTTKSTFVFGDDKQTGGNTGQDEIPSKEDSDEEFVDAQDGMQFDLSQMEKNEAEKVQEQQMNEAAEKLNMESDEDSANKGNGMDVEGGTAAEKSGDDTEADKSGGSPKDEDLSDTSSEKRREAEREQKFESPENFMQKLWNYSGPHLPNVVITLDQLLEECDHLDDVEFFGDLDPIDHYAFELTKALVDECGNSRADHKAYLLEIKEEVTEIQKDTLDAEADYEHEGNTGGEDIDPSDSPGSSSSSSSDSSSSSSSDSSSSSYTGDSKGNNAQATSSVGAQGVDATMPTREPSHEEGSQGQGDLEDPERLPS